MKKEKKNGKILWIIWIEVLVVAVCMLLSFVLPKKNIVVDGSEVQYLYTKDETSFYLGGERKLGIGSYDVTFYYDAFNGDNYYSFTLDGKECSQIHYDRWMNLLPGNTSQTAHMYLTAPVSRFMIQIRTMDTEIVTLKRAEIVKEHTDLRIFGICVGILCIIVHLLMYWYRKTKDRFLFGAVLIGLLAMLPVYTGYLTGGHDMTFHLYRIEGMKDAMLSGQFPVRIAPTPYQGYGNANPLYYPELFLYIPAFLRMAGFALHAVFLMTIAAVHFGTALISYASFDYLFQNKKTALLTCALYSFAFYRLEVMHYRYALGEGLAMMLLPLFIAVFARLLRCKERDFKTRRRTVLLLVVTFSAFLQSHLLSCMMLLFLGIVLVLFFGYGLVRNKTWQDLLIAIGITILINLWFLVPLKEAMGQDYQMRAATNEGISENALFVSQLFFPSGTFDGVTEDLLDGVYNEMPLTLGLLMSVAFIFELAIVPLVCKKRKSDERCKYFFFCLGMSVFYMFLCTNLCPWFLVREGGPLFMKLFGVVQFPWRYLSMASLFLTVGCGYGLLCVEKEKWTPLAYGILAAFALFCVLQFNQKITESDYPRRVYSEAMRKREYITKDYLDVNTDIHAIPTVEELLGSPYLISVDRQGSNLTANISNQTECAQSVDVPLFLFLGYEAWDDEGNEFELQSGQDGVIGIVVPSGYQGIVHVGVKEKPAWLIADGLSIGSLILSVLLYFLPVVLSGRITESR